MKKIDLKDFTNTMDLMEEYLITEVLKVLKEAGEIKTRQEARNILGNIGTRIVFGKEIFNKSRGLV